MDINQMNGIIRAVLPAILAYFVGNGFLSQESVGTILAAVLAIAAAGWSIYSNSPKQVIVSAATNPNVDKVVMKDSTVAAGIPNDKVVGK